MPTLDFAEIYSPELARHFFDLCAEHAEKFLAGADTADFVSGESPETLRGVVRELLAASPSESDIQKSLSMYLVYLPVTPQICIHRGIWGIRFHQWHRPLPRLKA